MSETNQIFFNDAAVRPDFYVDGFNPLNFLSLNNNDEGTKKLGLSADIKKLWFRLVHPNGRLQTTVVEHSSTHAVVRACVYADKMDSVCLAEATAIRYYSSQDPSKPYEQYHVDYAETIAISRALTNAGFDVAWCAKDWVSLDTTTGELKNWSLSTSTLQTPAQYSALTDPPETNPSAISVNAAQSELNTSASAVPDKTTVASNGQAACQVPDVQQQQTDEPVTQKETVIQKTGKEPQNYEEALRMISVDKAKSLIVDFGACKGMTLKQISLSNPGNLEWIAEKYKGNNFKVKAGAKILINASLV